MSHKQTQKTRRALAVRDGGLACHWCGQRLQDDLGGSNRPDFATIDHVVPRSRGGSSDLSNLVLACPGCNSARGDSMPETP